MKQIDVERDNLAADQVLIRYDSEKIVQEIVKVKLLGMLKY